MRLYKYYTLVHLIIKVQLYGFLYLIVPEGGLSLKFYRYIMKFYVKPVLSYSPVKTHPITKPTLQQPPKRGFTRHYFQFKLGNYLTTLTQCLILFILKFFPSWKVANYPDSYWFLYASKWSTYEVITQCKLITPRAKKKAAKKKSTRNYSYIYQIVTMDPRLIYYLTYDGGDYWYDWILKHPPQRTQGPWWMTIAPEFRSFGYLGSDILLYSTGRLLHLWGSIDQHYILLESNPVTYLNHMHLVPHIKLNLGLRRCYLPNLFLLEVGCWQLVSGCQDAIIDHIHNPPHLLSMTSRELYGDINLIMEAIHFEPLYDNIDIESLFFDIDKVIYSLLMPNSESHPHPLWFDYQVSDILSNLDITNLMKVIKIRVVWIEFKRELRLTEGVSLEEIVLDDFIRWEGDITFTLRRIVNGSAEEWEELSVREHFLDLYFIYLYLIDWECHLNRALSSTLTEDRRRSLLIQKGSFKRGLFISGTMWFGKAEVLQVAKNRKHEAVLNKIANIIGALTWDQFISNKMSFPEHYSTLHIVMCCLCNILIRISLMLFGGWILYWTCHFGDFILTWHKVPDLKILKLIEWGLLRLWWRLWGYDIYHLIAKANFNDKFNNWKSHEILPPPTLSYIILDKAFFMLCAGVGATGFSEILLYIARFMGYLTMWVAWWVIEFMAWTTLYLHTFLIKFIRVEVQFTLILYSALMQWWWSFYYKFDYDDERLMGRLDDFGYNTEVHPATFWYIAYYVFIWMLFLWAYTLNFNGN